MLIDELIERAFCDGYEYALEEQREFNRKARKLIRDGFFFKNGLKVIKKNPELASASKSEIKRRGRLASRGIGKPTNINEKITKKDRLLDDISYFNREAIKSAKNGNIRGVGNFLDTKELVKENLSKLNKQNYKKL